MKPINKRRITDFIVCAGCYAVIIGSDNIVAKASAAAALSLWSFYDGLTRLDLKAKP